LYADAYNLKSEKEVRKDKWPQRRKGTKEKMLATENTLSEMTWIPVFTGMTYNRVGKVPTLQINDRSIAYST